MTIRYQHSSMHSTLFQITCHQTDHRPMAWTHLSLFPRHQSKCWPKSTMKPLKQKYHTLKLSCIQIEAYSFLCLIAIAVYYINPTVNIRETKHIPSNVLARWQEYTLFHRSIPIFFWSELAITILATYCCISIGYSVSSFDNPSVSIH